MNKSYFIIDGSRLFSSIFEIWRTKKEFDKKKLNTGIFVLSLMRKWQIYTSEVIRVIFYFKKGDNRIKTMLKIPKEDDPGNKEHWLIKECGQALTSIPDEELLKIKEKYRDHFTRSEKGLDIQLTVDTLLLVASGRANNIVFLFNDRDYVPLMEAVQSLGANTYLTALDSEQKIQKDLFKFCDKYLTFDSELRNLFELDISVEKDRQKILKVEQV